MEGGMLVPNKCQGGAIYILVPTKCQDGAIREIIIWCQTIAREVPYGKRYFGAKQVPERCHIYLFIKFGPFINQCFQLQNLGGAYNG